MEGFPVIPVAVGPIIKGEDDDDDADDDDKTRLADGVVAPKVRPIMPWEDAATANSIRT